jgi:peroxiredoxin
MPLIGPGRRAGKKLAQPAPLKSRIKRDGLAKGDAAPKFELPRVGGGTVSLAQFHDSKLLLVFSDPNCGPCDLLAPRLERLSRRTPDIKVLMISRGVPADTEQKIKEHSLTFPVVLQRKWEISLRYAMFATPMAYLIDEKGIIASFPAVGAEAVLTLLRTAAITSLLEDRE